MKTTEGWINPIIKRGGNGNGPKCDGCGAPLGKRRNRSGKRGETVTFLCQKCWGAKLGKKAASLCSECINQTEGARCKAGTIGTRFYNCKYFEPKNAKFMRVV